MDWKASSRRIVKLTCGVQNYAWGHLGHQSSVARLHEFQSKLSIHEDKPYAELWMGTHDSCPSYVILDRDHGQHYHDSEGSTLLKDWLSTNPELLLGEKVVQRWGADLPFLFKVLSVAKALSIQAHPDKELARQLHKLRPDIYKDENHKPEMALAMTKFEALCGFVAMEELKQTLEMVPELGEVLGEKLSESLMNLPEGGGTAMAKSKLKEAFTAVMNTNKDTIRTAVDRLCTRLKEEQDGRRLSDKELLAVRLADQYPGDVGILSAFFFNYVRLEAGQALYLGANEPHAYLSGECLECMATSDNVVRAGLTPKHIDTATLCSMLTYSQHPPAILSGDYVNQYTRKYLPPSDEFEIDSCRIPAGHTAEFPAIDGPSILIVLHGSRCFLSEIHHHTDVVPTWLFLQTGDVLFVPAQTLFQLSVHSNADSDFHCYRAGVNSRVLQL